MVVFDESLYVKNPVVSVFVITYNQEKYIKECLDSIVNQSVDFPLELIVADDASVDRTRKICLEYQKKYPEYIKLLLNDVNLGLIKNYLNVLSYCKGKYIAQVAGDDYWCDTNKLSIQKKYLDDNESVGLVYTNAYKLSNGKFLKDFISYNVQSFEDHLRTPGYLAPNSWMYRTEFSPLKFLSKENAHYVDESYAYLLDIFKVTNVAFIPQYMVVYRDCEGTLSSYTSLEHYYYFKKGVFQIKKDYIKKYNVENKLKNEVYIDDYMQLLDEAVILSDTELIDEARDYFNANKITYEELSKLINKIVLYKKLYINIQKSKSYRIGKLILTPISIIYRFLCKKL